MSRADGDLLSIGRRSTIVSTRILRQIPTLCPSDPTRTVGWLRLHPHGRPTLHSEIRRNPVQTPTPAPTEIWSAMETGSPFIRLLGSKPCAIRCRRGEKEDGPVEHKPALDSTARRLSPFDGVERVDINSSIGWLNRPGAGKGNDDHQEGSRAIGVSVSLAFSQLIAIGWLRLMRARAYSVCQRRRQ